MGLPTFQSRRTVLESLGVSVVDFRCRAHVEPLGREEPNPTHGIVLVRRGVFRRKRQAETVIGDANHVLFFNAGEPYRYAHPLPGGDECTVLVVDGLRALELVRRHAPADAERPEAPFRLGHGLASPRAARLHYELLAVLRGGVRTLELDDVVAELADEAVAAAYRTHGVETGRRPLSTSAGRRWRDLAEAVKLAVNARLESLPSLGELARGLGCSPFHLSRTFHWATGVSLRDYVRRLRARRAADRVAAGARDLAALAVELGYADHGHFTNAFREEWGLPPSRFRERHRVSSRPPRNILQASRHAAT
jgi:AraC family transcriptional regulator